MLQWFILDHGYNAGTHYMKSEQKFVVGCRSSGPKIDHASNGRDYGAPISSNFSVLFGGVSFYVNLIATAAYK